MMKILNKTKQRMLMIWRRVMFPGNGLWYLMAWRKLLTKIKNSYDEVNQQLKNLNIKRYLSAHWKICELRLSS